VRVWLGERWFTVVGILEVMPLAPEIDSSALVGIPVAKKLLGAEGHPTTVYERSLESAVATVRDLLAATANPQNPESVQVSRRPMRSPRGRRRTRRSPGCSWGWVRGTARRRHRGREHDGHLRARASR
jgi:hypothetical protein